MPDFPYGKAALIILVLALVSGIWVASHPVRKEDATLTIWTFAKTHYDAYKPAVRSFETTHPGVKVDLQLVSGTAVTSRLQAAFWADLDVPDLVETEISSAGMFFRGPLESIGFVDLTDRIHRDGLWDGMVQARFAPYTSRGRIFGLPHDVHPVMIAYRRDIFEKEGIDVSKIKTWDDFIRVGRRLTIPNKRYMIELADTTSSSLEPLLLFQRGGGFFDEDSRCIFDNEIAVKTICWYVPLVAGPNKIGNNMGGGQILTKAVEDGYLLCLICPDWRSKFIEKDIPRVSGKMALMPLPRFSDGGYLTSTWGGTMLGITKHCRNQDLAWELAKHLYMSKPELGERFRDTNILPCLKSAWEQPAFYEKRAYWSNQQVGAMYSKLAPHVPPQYTSPFIVTAKAKMGEALVNCIERYKRYGDRDFEPFVRKQLKKNADELRTLMKRNPY